MSLQPYPSLLPVTSDRLSSLADEWKDICNAMKDPRAGLEHSIPEVKLLMPQGVDDRDAQRTASFFRAYMLGFNFRDSGILLMRDNSLTLGALSARSGDLRAIRSFLKKGGGKRRMKIQNSTHTTICINDDGVYILGTEANIRATILRICDKAAIQDKQSVLISDALRIGSGPNSHNEAGQGHALPSTSHGPPSPSASCPSGECGPRYRSQRRN